MKNEGKEWQRWGNIFGKSGKGFAYMRWHLSNDLNKAQATQIVGSKVLQVEGTANEKTLRWEVDYVVSRTAKPMWLE